MITIKKTIKRGDIKNELDLFSNKMLLDIQSDKVAYMIERNLTMVESVLKHQDKHLAEKLYERGKLSDEYLKEERLILEKYCNKNNEGQCVIHEGMFQIQNDKMDDFNKEKEELAIKYPDEGAKQKIHNEYLQKYLNEEIELEFYALLEKNIPANFTPRQRILLREYISE